MIDLNGRGALVTGAASGIGRAIALALGAAGMRVAFADLRSADVEAACGEAREAGIDALPLAFDVSDDAAVAAAAGVLERDFGKLHVLVNNAGVAFHGTPLARASAADWQWVLGVNVQGMANCTRHFLPLVRRHGEAGHVVNTASGSGFFVRPGRHQGLYAASKYAAVAFSEALELELAGTGIGVSVLCPAAVDTAIHRSAANRPDRLGGPAERPDEAFLKDLTAGAMPPAAVAARVVAAIRAGEFYIFTHASLRAPIEARHRRMMAAFDRLAGAIPA
jgi:NAD(P)-dependent dehydrogenase (short-subunit alcohol dehydrogenase family)